ncbi:recombinase family protein [Nonomuraea sp. MCN248]|uniref:Recombinase family protein n=1 Tax=Nonomuraea corallina TaxID=2989783 RepID=A0ABT4SIM3_9ACTN|nr:recombinase family protein [Nonomuraea corallina]MDA0637067.1 recombinase family protein [Nonomuraea corallina]
MNRAVILARISDADDGETTGVDDQVRRLRAFSAENGWDVVKVIVENDTSAFKRRKIKLPNGRYELRTVRPGFRESLDWLAEDRADILVARDLDRAMRDPRDLEDLIDVVESNRPRVRARSISGSLRLDNDADVTMARVMVAMANKSSRDTARRVSDARERQAMAGQFGGGRRPYGFESDGVTPIKFECDVIRRMADVVLLPTFGTPKGPSVAGIARELRADGITTADGGQWDAPAVRDVLMRPRNAALMVHKPGTGRKTYTPDDVVGEAPWEPIISPDEFWVIVGKLTDPNRRTNPGVAPHHLLSGIATCPCGSVVRVSGSSGKRDRPVYACQGGKGGAPGPHATAPKADLDALVEGLVITILHRDVPELIKPSQSDVDAGKLRGELAVIRERKVQLGEDHDMGLVDRAEYVRRAKKLQVRIEDLERQLADAAESSPFAAFANVVTEDDVRRVWEDQGIARQREIVKNMMTITLKPVGKGRRPSIAERVEIRPKVA